MFQIFKNVISLIFYSLFRSCLRKLYSTFANFGNRSLCIQSIKVKDLGYVGKKPYWLLVVRVTNVLNSFLPKVLLKNSLNSSLWKVICMYKTEEGYCPISCCVTNNALYLSTLNTNKVVVSYIFFVLYFIVPIPILDTYV